MSDQADPWVQRGLEKLQQGRAKIAGVEQAVAADIFALPGILEERARDALAVLRSAMDWLEDTSHFEDAHAALDRAGAFVRETFGCSLTFDDGRYWQECPVALAHARIGLSPAMVIGAAQCSVCGQDPATCEHVTGREYDGEICHRVITRVDEILEVSFVSRPMQPDARIHRTSVSIGELRETHGEHFTVGARVSCDRCLSHCPGIDDDPLALHR